MTLSLNEIFTFIYNKEEIRAASNVDLFGFEDNASGSFYTQADIDFVNAYFSRGFNVSAMNSVMRNFFDLSFNAFDIVLHAWLSDLPVERETVAYGRSIAAAAASSDDKRRAAEKTAANRLDADALTVLNASAKVQREVHRMMGLLRFNPGEKGGFTALCECDHFILPCLIEYFTSRFGEIPWTIIDVKRNLRLCRRPGEKAKVEKSKGLSDAEDINASCGDAWEDLWKHYHKTINNEDRNNPNLQRQFMPQRYWKYLPEK